MELFIDKYITIGRLSPYLKRCNNNPKKALTLYEINMAYSSELYKLLSILEISLRNLINERCIKLFGYDWITNIKYDIHLHILNSFYNTNENYVITKNTFVIMEKIFSIQESMIKDTIARLKEENKPMTNDYIVSRSLFGFWTNLFNRVYEATLWNKSLANIFNKQFTRNKIEHILNEFRWLRNRIAHNGCVIDMKYSPEIYCNKILKFLEIIDPKLSSWASRQLDMELLG